MKRFLKLRHGEKGFTLIELLVVVAILGILAIVVVPNVATMIGSADVAAANTEAASVETASIAFLADNNGVAPDPFTSANLTDYLHHTLKATYTLDHSGFIIGVSGSTWAGINWDGTKWVKD